MVTEDEQGENGVDCGVVSEYYKSCRASLEDQSRSLFKKELKRIRDQKNGVPAPTKLDGTALKKLSVLECHLRTVFDQKLNGQPIFDTENVTADDIANCDAILGFTLDLEEIADGCEEALKKKRKVMKAARDEAAYQTRFYRFLIGGQWEG